MIDASVLKNGFNSVFGLSREKLCEESFKCK